MKRLLLLLLIPAVVSAQTAVDRLSAALDSLSMYSFTDWRMSPDLKVARLTGIEPAQQSFDDSRWEVLALRTSVYPDSCWLRKEIVLPKHVLGEPVSGRVRLLLTLDDYGSVWVNGVAKGPFLWDGDITLTDNARPGERFLIAIKAVNTGGPMRLLRAEILMEKTSALRDRIRDFSMSLRVGQRLLSFETYQINAYSGQKEDPGIDKSRIPREERARLGALLHTAAAVVNTRALGEGDIPAFTRSLDAARAQLQPVKAFAKRFTLVFTSNAHIDAAWLWRESETRVVARNTFSSVLSMMDARPDFTYSQSAAQYYAWMQESAPDVFARIQQRVRDKRWEITGGMWIEPDCNLPAGESWMRHFLFAQHYFRKQFGFAPRLGWNPDSFGYTWNMPQFFTLAGIDAFITQKISWNDTNVFPYRVFWWEGPDGSRVLVYFPFSYVNELSDSFELVDWLRQFEANTGFTTMMVLFGVGDHGGGPTPEMLSRVDQMKMLEIFPTVQFATADEYLQYLRGQDTRTLPVWRDELYLEYHRGTFTTQASTKENNRRSEALLTTAEKAASLASLYGGTYPNLRRAWEHVLFNQFHDILPGSSIREVYIDAAERYTEAQTAGRVALRKGLLALADRITTAGVTQGTPLIVFNPLSWARTDIATVELAEGDEQEYAVFDGAVEVPSQILAVGPYTRHLQFLARDIPSLGYKVYALRTTQPRRTATSLSVSPSRLENAVFVVSIDTVTGWINSITDKRTGRQALAGNGNVLQALEDKPKAWDAWNIGWTGVEYPTTVRALEIIDKGPLRATIRVHRDMLGPSFKRDYPAEGFPSSFFTQDITLYDGIDLIHFTTNVDWWEEKTMLKVAFPVAAADTIAAYEIPYGHIYRSTQSVTSYQKAQKEVPALRWADLSGKEYGVSLLNTGKYGYDIKGNMMRLSLLRSPKWPDPTADRGKHVIRYALYPHEGSWQAALTVRKGYMLNVPLEVVTTSRHKGILPAHHSFVTVAPANLVLTTIKKAEEGDGWIFQLYDAHGEPARAELTLPRPPASVHRSNFLEDRGESIPFAGRRIALDVGRNQIVTLRITFTQDPGSTL